jgi:hypothetical protein
MRLLIPIETEPWEVKRKRVLRKEIDDLWSAIISVQADIGQEKMRSGLCAEAGMPTPRSPKMDALHLGLNELSRLHSAALAEHANLV